MASDDRKGTNTIACCCSCLSNIIQFLWKCTKGQRWKIVTRNLSSHKHVWVSQLLCGDPRMLSCIQSPGDEPRGETGSRTAGTTSESKVIAKVCTHEDTHDVFKVVMLNRWFKPREMLRKYCSPRPYCSGWPSGVPDWFYTFMVDMVCLDGMPGVSLEEFLQDISLLTIKLIYIYIYILLISHFPKSFIVLSSL